jgi:hypothetical protein
MKKWVLGSLTGLLALLVTVWSAPSTWAMVAGPDPGGGSGGSVGVDSGGTRIWQVVAVVVVAVVIGAVGALVAQRVRRGDERFAPVA